MAAETMRKPRYSVVKLQPRRVAIFNNLEEKGKSTKETVKKCFWKWDKTRRKWYLDTKQRTNYKEKKRMINRNQRLTTEKANRDED